MKEINNCRKAGQVSSAAFLCLKFTSRLKENHPGISENNFTIGRLMILQTVLNLVICFIISV